MRPFSSEASEYTASTWMPDHDQPTTPMKISRLTPTLLIFPALAAAQATKQIPVRQLGPAEAVSREHVGYLYGVRELSDGRLVVNDVGNRRLVMFDRALARHTVVADTTERTRRAYGPRPTGIIPYAGDTTLLIDLAARALIVVAPDGTMPRVMSPPRPADIPYLWNPAIGSPRFDAAGKLVYRTYLMPSFRPPEHGKPFVPPAMPDSAPLLRADFDTRRADTVAWVGIARSRLSVTPLGNGGITVRQMINPVAFLDDWTLLPDGTIAILRGRDYHVDWIAPDGTRTSSPKMPFDWKRLTDPEKAAMIDSTRKALERRAAAGPSAAGAPGSSDAGGTAGHSMTIMPVGPGDGGPAPRESGGHGAAAAAAQTSIPEVVPASELPDYVPPVLRSGTMKADPQGNVWILPSTSAQSGGGLLYDVVNRAGEIAYRVRLPAGRALEGFGANGAVYLTAHEGGTARLERARLK